MGKNGSENEDGDGNRYGDRTDVCGKMKEEEEEMFFAGVACFYLQCSDNIGDQLNLRHQAE
ncbi:hypothetical protein N7488_003012 [Penicillium malachiteum]|nr:hypothetical protein N7488_003012 [Penicillium malachiteum]